MKPYTGKEIREYIEKAKITKPTNTASALLDVTIALAMIRYNKGLAQNQF